MLTCVCCFLSSGYPLLGHLALWHHGRDLKSISASATPAWLYLLSSPLTPSMPLLPPPHGICSLPFFGFCYILLLCFLCMFHIHTWKGKKRVGGSQSFPHRETLLAQLSYQPSLQPHWPQIAFIFIPFSRGQDDRVTWCQEWWPMCKEPLRQG